MTMHRLVSIGLLAALLLGVRLAAGAQAVEVRTERRSGAVLIDATAVIDAPFAVIWSTLTDYDHLGEFIPGMRSSRVIGRHGAAAVVEQVGEAGFLFFRYSINVVVESAEYPPDIEIRVLSGNIKRLDGRYRVEPGDRAGQWRLRWFGLIEPSVPLPPLFGEAILRRNVTAQFRGMVEEIERRFAAQPQAVGGRRELPWG
jgi:carbon monoxide dehydrogenase subunit G